MKTFEIIYSSEYNGKDFEHFVAGLKAEHISADNTHQACFEFGKDMAYTDMTIEILKVTEIGE
jgi:hypothetical protein